VNIILDLLAVDSLCLVVLFVTGPPFTISVMVPVYNLRPGCGLHLVY